MVDERAPALARRLSAPARVLRRGRIFARLREGWACDEIASQERLTAERERQIVRQALEKCIIDESAEHAKLQFERLQPAMRLACEAIAEGDVKAIAPLMRRLPGATRRRQWWRASGSGGLGKKPRQGSAQALEKARFGQGNPRESKGFFVAFHRFSWSNRVKSPCLI